MEEMKKIWEARRLIRQGVSVKEVAARLRVTESVVRNYTKAERKIVKEKECLSCY